jgi:NADH-quinone oxidoreductase subunit N
VLALRKKGAEVREISDLAGIGHRYPGLAALMSLFLLSLAGLPPTCGFFGKLFLIQALVGMNTPLPWLIVLFVLTSVVSFYYYLGPVKTMYMEPAGAEAARDTVQSADWELRVALGGCAIGTIAIGLWATLGYGMAQSVAQAVFAAGQ